MPQWEYRIGMFSKELLGKGWIGGREGGRGGVKLALWDPNPRPHLP